MTDHNIFPYWQESKKDNVVSIKLTKNDIKALKKMSKESNQSISSIIRSALYNDLFFHKSYKEIYYQNYDKI